MTYRDLVSSLIAVSALTTPACGDPGGDEEAADTTTTADGGSTSDTGFGATGEPPPDAETCLRDEDCPADHKCNVAYDFDGEAEQTCVRITGNLTAGQACRLPDLDVAEDECVRGATCLTDPDGEQGRCVALCDAPDDACADPTRTCTVAYGGDVRLCLQSCDPLDASACPDGWICHEATADQRWYCAPRLGGQTGGHGSSCTAEGLGLCAPGLACLGNAGVDSEACADPLSGSGCCAQLCNLDDAAAPCPGELEQCLPYYQTPPPDLANLGVCAVPLSPR